MKGFVIGGGCIAQKELRWVDPHEDEVRDGDGILRERGTWSLLLDTAKDIAIKQVEATLAANLRGGYAASAARDRERLREMRGEGKFVIEMKKES